MEIIKIEKLETSGDVCEFCRQHGVYEKAEYSVLVDGDNVIPVCQYHMDRAFEIYIRQ